MEALKMNNTLHRRLRPLGRGAASYCMTRILGWSAFIISAGFLLLAAPPAWAGPYAPAAGKEGTTALHMDNIAFAGWARDWADYEPGSNVDEAFGDADLALGKAKGDSFDIVSLGRGGKISLIFDPAVRNGASWDFAVFENSFSDLFLELAFVEVSSDGVNFIRFESASLTQNPVGGYGTVDPTDVDGLAGKYRQGYGTPFDLQDLAERQEVLDGTVNLGAISHIRIIDIVGDGGTKDSSGRVIYDPYPTSNSAGFDLDAAGAIYTAGDVPAVNAPEKPAPVSPLDGSTQTVQPLLESSQFSDQDVQDLHMLTTWQISENDAGFNAANIVLELTSADHLVSLTPPMFVLGPSTTYYWRVKYYDTQATASQWSDPFSFTTQADASDLDGNGVPDDQQTEVDWDGDGNPDAGVKSADGVNSGGQAVTMGLEGASNVASVDALMTVDPADADAEGRPDKLGSGLLAFKVSPADPAQFVQVKIHLSRPAASGATWYKYDSVDGWREYPHAEFAPDGSYVILTLKDGSEEYGDSDGVQNGSIVDPGGPGTAFVQSAPSDGEAGLGGGGDCFILSLE